VATGERGKTGSRQRDYAEDPESTTKKKKRYLYSRQGRKSENATSPIWRKQVYTSETLTIKGRSWGRPLLLDQRKDATANAQKKGRERLTGKAPFDLSK